MRYVVLTLALLFGNQAVAQERFFQSDSNFCDIEVRQSMSPNPEAAQQIYRGQISSGQRTIGTMQTFLFARREANPGVCGNPGRSNWLQCSTPGSCRLS